MAVDSPTDRVRRGVPLDRLVFDHAVASRGMSYRELARVSGVSEIVISRARAGRPISYRTVRRLADALVRPPVTPGSELVIGIHSKVSRGRGPAEVEAIEEVPRVSATTS